MAHLIGIIPRLDIFLVSQRIHTIKNLQYALHTTLCIINKIPVYAIFKKRPLLPKQTLFHRPRNHPGAHPTTGCRWEQSPLILPSTSQNVNFQPKLNILLYESGLNIFFRSYPAAETVQLQITSSPPIILKSLVKRLQGFL